MLKEGYLKVDPDSKFIVDYPDIYKEYQNAQQFAQQNNIGIWANNDEPKNNVSP